LDTKENFHINVTEILQKRGKFYGFVLETEIIGCYNYNNFNCEINNKKRREKK